MRKINQITRDLRFTHIKCPICKGEGKFDYGPQVDQGEGGIDICYKCNGAGVIPN